MTAAGRGAFLGGLPLVVALAAASVQRDAARPATVPASLPSPPAVGAAATVESHERTWDDALRANVRLARLLPEPTQAERSAGAGPLGHLPSKVAECFTYRAPLGSPDWAADLNALVLSVTRAGDRPKVIRELARLFPDLDAKLPFLFPTLRGEAWSGGFWSVDASEHPADPWNGTAPGSRVEQGVVLVEAGLAEIRRAERDLAKFHALARPPHLAESRPLEGSYFRGRDPAGRDFSTIAVFHRLSIPSGFLGLGRRDIPFALRILDRADAGGARWVSEFYASAPGDPAASPRGFRWMAGRRTYFPIVDERGEDAAHFVVTEFGWQTPEHANSGDRARDELLTNLRTLRAAVAPSAAPRRRESSR